jgi:hypothetical protein
MRAHLDLTVAELEPLSAAFGPILLVPWLVLILT